MGLHQQRSFVQGELGRELQGRVDLRRYYSSAKLIKNMVVQKEGGAKRRWGTKVVARDFGGFFRTPYDGGTATIGTTNFRSFIPTGKDSFFGVFESIRPKGLTAACLFRQELGLINRLGTAVPPSPYSYRPSGRIFGPDDNLKLFAAAGIDDYSGVSPKDTLILDRNLPLIVEDGIDLRSFYEKLREIPLNTINGRGGTLTLPIPQAETNATDSDFRWYRLFNRERNAFLRTFHATGEGLSLSGDTLKFAKNHLMTSPRLHSFFPVFVAASVTGEVLGAFISTAFYQLHPQVSKPLLLKSNFDANGDINNVKFIFGQEASLDYSGRVALFCIDFGFTSPQSGFRYSLEFSGENLELYKSIEGQRYGLLTTLDSRPTFTDLRDTNPRYDQQPPRLWNILDRENLHPTKVYSFGQRTVLSGFSNFPRRVIASKIGEPFGFYEDTVPNASSIIDINLAGDINDEVTFLAQLNGLLVGTDSAEHRVGEGLGLSPQNLQAGAISYNGSSALRPVKTSRDLIFLHKDRRTVMGTAYSEEAGSQVPESLTRFDPNRFKDDPPVAWDIQTGVQNIVWIATESGAVHALTYNRESEVMAWHTHDFGGKVRDIKVNLEAEEVWMLIERTINGNAKVTLESFPMYTDGEYLDQYIEIDWPDEEEVTRVNTRSTDPWVSPVRTAGGTAGSKLTWTLRNTTLCGPTALVAYSPDYNDGESIGDLLILQGNAFVEWMIPDDIDETFEPFLNVHTDRENFPFGFSVGLGSPISGMANLHSVPDLEYSFLNRGSGSYRINFGRRNTDGVFVKEYPDRVLSEDDTGYKIPRQIFEDKFSSPEFNDFNEKQVGIVAKVGEDGKGRVVVASEFDGNAVTVKTDGTITLSDSIQESLNCFDHLHGLIIGLEYDCRLETLSLVEKNRIDDYEANKKVKISSAVVHLMDTIGCQVANIRELERGTSLTPAQERGISVTGGVGVTEDANLEDYTFRSITDDASDSSISPKTGPRKCPLSGVYGEAGRIAVIQKRPVNLHVLGVELVGDFIEARRRVD